MKDWLALCEDHDFKKSALRSVEGFWKGNGRRAILNKKNKHLLNDLLFDKNLPFYFNVNIMQIVITIQDTCLQRALF